MTTASISVSLENIVRPFVVKDSRPDPAAAIGEATDVGALANVSITWGAAGGFDLPPSGFTTGAEADTAPQIIDNPNGYGKDGQTGPIAYSDPIDIPPGDFWDDDDEDADGERRTKNYREVERVVETVRIENPDDETQYVEVDRITEIEFEGPDAWNHRFYLFHPPVR